MKKRPKWVNELLLGDAYRKLYDTEFYRLIRIYKLLIVISYLKQEIKNEGKKRPTQEGE